MAEKRPINKKKVAIIAAAVAAAVAVAGVASYFAFFKDNDKSNPETENESTQEEIEGELPSAKDDALAPSDANDSSDGTDSSGAGSKYDDAEIYTNKNGNPAAKTESGVEVEITGENMAELIKEYEKVKGSGSEREKELLDQIQLILEASQGNQ